MTRQGGRGRGRGRGGGRGKGNSSGDKKAEKKKGPEMKFTPIGTGKPGEYATFTTVKRTMLRAIQTTFEHGADISDTLETMEVVDIDEDIPLLKESSNPDPVARKK